MSDIKAINRKLDLILAGQVVLFKKLEKIQNVVEKRTRLAPDSSHAADFKREVEKMLPVLETIVN